VLTDLFLDRLWQKYMLWLRNLKSENKKIHSFHKHNSCLACKSPFTGTIRCVAWVITALCYTLYLHCHPEWFSQFFYLFRDIDAPIPMVKPTRYTGASSWFYYRNNITMHGPMNVKYVCAH
jgi:hypothetical protein